MLLLALPVRQVHTYIQTYQDITCGYLSAGVTDVVTVASTPRTPSDQRESDHDGKRYPVRLYDSLLIVPVLVEKQKGSAILAYLPRYTMHEGAIERRSV